jgi:DNA-binding GntR family transcriptional regulator
MATGVIVTTLVDALAEQLRAQIVSGDFEAGDRITEQSVAERYDVARPTAKAAIERVVQWGVLRREANKTAHVPEFSTAEIEDIYHGRLFLEHGVVKLLAVKKASPDAAHSALADMKRAIDNGELSQAVDADVRFHTALVTAVGSTRLLRAYQSLMGEAQLCMARERRASIFRPYPNYEDHVAILDAVTKGDTKTAQKLITAHFVDAVNRILGRPLETKGWV